MTTSLSNDQARRIALAAQGFADPRPAGRVDRRHVRKVFDRIGLIQVDSVNVLVRSEEMPLFSRLGPHQRGILRAMAADGELFEYWGHEASLLPVALHPLMRWRMEAAKKGDDSSVWGGLRDLHLRKPAEAKQVLQAVRDRGPVLAGDLAPRTKPRGQWWSWDGAKPMLENLFWGGHISALRQTNFEREYDLVERILPANVLAAPPPATREARKQLLELSARCHGVGTARDLADYFRQNIPTSKPLLQELVDEGRLLSVAVDGWREPAYLHPTAKRPRNISARALLSPFDSLIWERTRTERVFGFHYRIEIYVPAEKRKHGYYVLPFLLGDRLVARVDLKADRKAGVLLVQSAHAEPHADPHHTAEELGAELRELATWLGLDDIRVARRGDLAATLLRAVGP
jgi:uncharacterized protein